MESFFVELGERGHAMEGKDHGLAAISLIWSETARGGGPPLHKHICDEIHVLPACRMSYIIGDERFEAEGPCVVKIPAQTAHTFTNAGTDPILFPAFFPHPTLMDHYEIVGPNPLI